MAGRRKTHGRACCSAEPLRGLFLHFLRQDCSVVFFEEWSQYRDMELEYSSGDSWDRMLQVGFQLLDRFAQEDRVRILRPRKHLQVKFSRPISPNTEFVM